MEKTMSFTITEFNYDEWKLYGLKDYSDFAECVSECNQHTWGDDTTSGEWFFVDDEPPLPPGEPDDRVIYFGTWGNDNSPGTSMYTHGEIFDMSNPNDAAKFEKRKAEWEAFPEWCETEEDEDDEDD
jgi:hypothetical protein